jgi:hypothetical protein
MESNQAISLAVGAGILGSVATYLLLNNNEDTNNENIETNVEMGENVKIGDVKKEIQEDVKKEVDEKKNDNLLKTFWKSYYNDVDEKQTFD